MKLRPLICGKWDGTALWVQWDAVGDGVSYEMQVRYRNNSPRGGAESAEWGDWIRTVPPQGERSHWGVVPTWKEGWSVEMRVRVKGEEEFETAREVTFTQCSAPFEISTTKYDLNFVAGHIFHSQVHGAACAYQSREAIQLKAGTLSHRVTLYAMGTGGYFQLDKPGDFELSPTIGAKMHNTGPSVDDVKETGRDFTVIEAKAFDMVTMTVLTSDPSLKKL